MRCPLLPLLRPGLAVGLLATLLAACGGGGSGGGMLPIFLAAPPTETPPPEPSPPVPVVPPKSAPTGLTVDYAAKRYDFRWTPVDGASFYQLVEDADGPGPAEPQTVAERIAGTQHGHIITLYQRLNARYAVRACNVAGCSEVSETIAPDVARAIGYLKPSNTATHQNFGTSVALSADGRTLAVGAFIEDSAATGIDGDQHGTGATDSGAVYVFARTEGTWVQQAYVKASNTGANDGFGWHVALSADGDTLAVSAGEEDSDATGIDGDQANDRAPDAGAVYVFARRNGSWRQQAYVKASNTGAGDGFGNGLALSGDGNTLAVGANMEASGATGIDGNQALDDTWLAGAVYVFVRDGERWAQQAYVKASDTAKHEHFGWSVALSGDGNTLAVGAPLKNDAPPLRDTGAVYLFSRNGGTWAQQARLWASNPAINAGFGTSVALSADGQTLAVGAEGEASNATGIDGNQADNSAPNAGAVYVFAHAGSAWSQQAYIKASNTDTEDAFGHKLALSADGRMLAIASYGESSAATGLNGNQGDNSVSEAGAVYLFARDDKGWAQQHYLKSPSPDPTDIFGFGLALSADGSTLAVGAYREDGSATGVGGDPRDNSSPGAGAVFLY